VAKPMGLLNKPRIGLLSGVEDVMNETDKLANALDVVLEKKAERFLHNLEYIAYVEKCVEDLQLTDPKLAFLFGGLDAMQQDFGSAAQMTRPPGTRLDVSCRKNRFKRLLNWKEKWEASGVLRSMFP
jgi:hypothetical protein